MVAVKIINSFTYNGKGGNPAGVVYLNGNFPTDQTMLSIAKAIGLSETVFVRDRVGGGYSMRYFTPEAEVPLCGHATLAACYDRYRNNALSGNPIVIETGAGLIQVDQIHSSDRNVHFWMAQPSPIFEALSPESIALVTNCFQSLKQNSSLPICIGSTGLRDIIIPIESRDALNEVIMLPSALSSVSEHFNVTGAHLFAIENDAVYARNFAPLYGIDEESATGTSNGVLIAYLQKFAHSAVTITANAKESKNALQCTILQGETMGKLSQILTHVVSKNDTQYPTVGGSCIADHTVYLCDLAL
ncbi:PhzF family phenazine biosynthesis protein [Fusibacter paucivorans]|uniref:PhzF family phenazine biosynthesis protein n=1 Tax=Fusibacter paucivorans TaxID=76009 RepID=A0ABS5PTY0_9FIRM|nr:PhzF family phenazine biosynthesis protein [Fusibacter paucivorans]MBS7528628.1 PhzF family phenazine biosynthesis protein [Fusibacter paucivorans]